MKYDNILNKILSIYRDAESKISKIIAEGDVEKKILHSYSIDLQNTIYKIKESQKEENPEV